MMCFSFFLSKGYPQKKESVSFPGTQMHVGGGVGPVYLVMFQIYAFKADSSLVAHRDEHRIWILEPRTVCALKQNENKLDTLIIYILNMLTT